ncbi:MAG: tRNA lysidine(34) synthetase TilS, partial [Clostridia bacterium]|nr:tRNA lysidine(34) synthetase TilS [Clostridia bacterium]
ALLASGLRLVIRHQEQGDVIKPLVGPGRKSLRRFLSDAGIDALKRPGLYVLACEEDDSRGGNSRGGEAYCEELNSRGDEASCEEENLRGGEASCGICHVFGVRRGDIFAVQKETKSCIIIDCSKPDEQAALK